MKAKISLVVLAIVLLFFSQALFAEDWQNVFSDPRTQSVQLNDSQDPSEEKKKLRFVFVQGQGAQAVFNHPGSTFEKEIRETFTGHTVEFYQKGITRKKLLEAIQGADIFYLNGHSVSTPYHGMQNIQVAPSPDNDQISSSGISVITPLDIKRALHNKKAPKLVYFNVCSLTDSSDGVPSKARFASAFGRGANSKGGAFVGFPRTTMGFVEDGVFKKVLFSMAQEDDQGNLPTLGEVISKRGFWVDPKAQPNIIGDGQIRLNLDLDENTLAGKWSIAGRSKEGASATGHITFSEDKSFKSKTLEKFKNGQQGTYNNRGSWTLSNKNLVMKYVAGAIYDGIVEGDSKQFTMTATNNGWTQTFTKMTSVDAQSTNDSSGFSEFEVILPASPQNGVPSGGVKK